jgi:hypothetical protein
MLTVNKSGVEPRPDRPFIAEPDYGIPTTLEGVLPWSHVTDRMQQARNYWVGTVGPGERPHAVPVWGVWVGDTLYFGGGPRTRWSRNLAANPRVAVHLESGDDVVILEGEVDQIVNPQHPLLAEVDDAYEQKYGMRHGPPVWVLRPRLVLAWSEFPTNATRWRFEDTRQPTERKPDEG